MKIVELSPGEVKDLVAHLQRAIDAGLYGQVLVAVDGLPREPGARFKVKINYGIWSPPLGSEYRG